MSEERRSPGSAYTNPKQVQPQTTEIQPPVKDGKDGKKKIRVKETQKTFGERIAENFLATDRREIKEHLLFDWLIPELKSALEDILHMILYGTKAGGRNRRRESGRNYGSYNSIYDERKLERERANSADPTRQNFRHIKLTFYTREDAMEVLDDLRESLDESSGGFVTVKELYSLSELPTNATMYNWGWFDLEDARIIRQGNDFVLEMPRAEVIGR